MQREILSIEQKQFRTVGLVMLLVAVGLVFLRIVVRFIPFPDNAFGDIISDVIFTIPMQVGLMVIMPYFIYKKCLKKDFKGVMKFSNLNKTRYYNYLLSIAIGICVYIATIGVSTVWQGLIGLLGYKRGSSVTHYPDSYGFLAFLLSLFLTGILPGFCEEFTNRGGFLTTMKGSYRMPMVILLGAISFGLFHQNITQVFYTACFGGLMTYLTIKTKSVFPSMIIHFMNNGLNVYFEYSNVYGWAGGGMYDIIDSQLLANPMLVIGAYMVICVVGALLVYLMLYLNSKDKIVKKLEMVKDSGFDHTNNRVVLFGEENKSLVEDVGLINEVYGKSYTEDKKFKPSLRDGAFFIGAIVITVLTTIFSLIWGLF